MGKEVDTSGSPTRGPFQKGLCVFLGLCFVNVAPNVDRLDGRLTKNAFFFLLRREDPNDDLLSALAARGVFNVFTLPGGLLTKEGILDFAFGSYNNRDETKRSMKLQVAKASKLSPTFLSRW